MEEQKLYNSRIINTYIKYVKSVMSISTLMNFMITLILNPMRLPNRITGLLKNKLIVFTKNWRN